MLKIKKRRSIGIPRIALLGTALLLLSGGLYLLLLVASPSLAPLITMKPIEVRSLPAPQATDNRVIIPKIGVNIPYDKGAASLDRGAEWRYPERGNPEKGGNFIIAAHRFSIQPTPQGTIEKSPFYHIDKLAVGDKIVIDYIGTRYGYEIEKIFTVKPTQVEIEAPSTDAKLTLYTCELDGSDAGRVVVVAKPLGKVAL
ncbi:putative sortase family protein [Candidatus Saccharimonas aalborgensis]|uniref:Putative sortase family protein n=1 Tax=Candidatus Saccharimonas aalborgensis TaxID=1332188 RepID=R4PWA1_9BACT|nr:class E sortase [Candidatus Saccharimonas aalborgensis]MBP7775039.1 class E sortase [Candidatus Saccharimonas sp.]QQR50803.1 MAG: class E sortase [Candidatus Saccharibacteria bacterium]AGL62027.1 putative sortase family protein [Candidatus Saccharimonas aalborgensis]QQS68551.1 MAG: class E sortase [Candidatus Saccharibacteria bacterium]QQS70848.1 MAG: class E sortase [Candidatus Saccharibacteria bacterium]